MKRKNRTVRQSKDARLNQELLMLDKIRYFMEQMQRELVRRDEHINAASMRGLLFEIKDVIKGLESIRHPQIQF